MEFKRNKNNKILLAIDVGYSGFGKITFQDQMFKFQLSFDYYNDHGIDYGENTFYEYNGEKLVIGTSSQTEDSFSTTDFKFLKQYGPLAIFHIIKKLGLLDYIDDLELKLGLALIDWNKRLEFLEAIKNISCKDSFGNVFNISFKHIVLYTQGQGCASYFVMCDNNGVYPGTFIVIDIGYNTINLLYFENGKPVATRSKPLPGHGISTIIKPFKTFLESLTSMNFSEAEAISIFISGRMNIHGIEKVEVTNEITRLKGQFIQKLMKQLMVSEKKGLAMADVVLFSGGGSYYIKDAKFPPNFKFNSKGVHEYENVLGYYYDEEYKNTETFIV